MKYGIPEFRLPNAIVDYEIDGLRKMGVDFEKDIIIGKTLTYDALLEAFREEERFAPGRFLTELEG